MILDKYLDYNTKITISIVSAMIWIFFRTSNNYCGLPNHSVLSAGLVGGWTYLHYKDPIFLPIGLMGLYLYSIMYYNKNFKLE